MNKETLYGVWEVTENLYEQLPIDFDDVDIHDKSKCEEALRWAEGLVSDLDFNITQLFIEKMKYLYGEKADARDIMEYVSQLDAETKIQEELLHDANVAVEVFKDAIAYLENEDLEVLYSVHSEWL